MENQSSLFLRMRPYGGGGPCAEHNNSNTTIGTTEGPSVLDSHFIDSHTSVSISNQQSTSDEQRKALAPLSNTSIDNRVLAPAPNNNNRSNDNNAGNTQNNRIGNNVGDLDKSKQAIALDCSSFIDPNSFSTPVLSSAASTFSNRVLSDLYTTPDSNTFDTQDSPLSTPITPISPGFCGFKKQPSLSQYSRYPLNDAQLEKFVLSPSVFHLSLDEKIGKGSNAYVYSCEISTVGIQNSSFNVAVKIPISRNKVKHIIQETKFAIKLRNYQDEWFKTHNRFYPFIDCYGLYYLNREQFPLFKRNDELPCLLMKKMSVGLSTYISTSEQLHDTDTRLPLPLWWKLCKTLLDALTILKTLSSVHCDLKTDNIMVLQVDESEDQENHQPEKDVLFKVIDFSSACEIESLIKCPDMTLQYTAPELLDFTKKPLPTFQSDLFSAGLVLLEAATGSQPYATASYDHFYLLTVIKEGRVLDWLSAEDINILKAHPDIHTLLRKILVERATLEEIVDFVDRTHVY